MEKLQSTHTFSTTSFTTQKNKGGGANDSTDE